jgi:hypothetical protein
MKIQVTYSSPDFGLADQQIEIEGHILRCDWPAKDIEAMVGFWEFSDEFLAFKGPKIFYCCEPSFYFGGYRSAKRLLRGRLANLRQDEFAWHYHSEAAMRVVHHSYGAYQSPPPQVVTGGPRRKKAAAVIGNLGHPFARNAGRQKRLNFILESGCDIYGSKTNWENFQIRPWSRKGPPATYCGPSLTKTDTLSSYHANICLENSVEPLYFTEKLPDAVRAGCIPIYHPHPSVKSAFLDGAVWVDPADYGWDAVATLNAAMHLDREAVQEANNYWMTSNPSFLKTRLAEVYRNLVKIIIKKMSGEINLPGQAARERLKDEY